MHEGEAQVERDAVFEARARCCRACSKMSMTPAFTGGRLVIAERGKNGKKRKLNVAHLTLLGQVCNNFASQVALTSCTYQKIFAAELKKQGVDWTPSRRCVRRFLGASG